jgi:flagellar basal-body rod protein FlgB
MPLDLDQALGPHVQALAARARRSEVLAANLANADTPGYKARDLDFAGLITALGTPPALAPRATHAAHLGGATATAADAGGELRYRVPAQAALDGNTVDSQVEQAEFARNAIAYQASLTFLSGRIRTLLTAIRGD